LKTVLAPKVWGAWHLHELTKDLSLDLFVLYSSAAALLGSPGQGSHVAANSFLDGLAHYRHRLGLPALSINWGPWSEVGSAATAVIHRQMRSRGVGAISPDQGKRALSQLLLTNRSPQIGVVPIQWSQFQQQGIGRDPFFANFNQTGHRAAFEKKADWQAQIKQLPQRQRIGFLTQALQTEVAKVLGLAGNQKPELTTSFFDMGMDSLMAVELKNQLDAHLGTPVAATVIFEFPTIRTLAAHLVEMVCAADPPPADGLAPDLHGEPPPANPDPPPDVSSEIEQELAALETLLERS
ncbi:MAG: KR domain-containing protein, partial [Symploca sp. SIO2G7]|nr:KR domain-containing protein [Symploca sp. SIO2G7]